MACLTSTPSTTLCVLALLASLGGCTVNIPDAESSSSEGDDDDDDDDDDDGTEESDSGSGAGEESTGDDETTGSTTSGTSSTSTSSTSTSSTSTSSTSTSSTSTSGDTTTGDDTGTSDTEGTGVPATFETMVEIFRVTCQGAGCHSGETHPELLPSDPNLYTAVMTQVSEACGGIPFVTPFEPENSAFLRIITGPCGTIPRMPNNGCNEMEENCLPPAYIEAVEQWIADGAPE